MFVNCIQPEIKKILRKNQKSFQRNWSTMSQILTICQTIKWIQAKNLKATLLFINFSWVFDCTHREKMEQILQAYHHHHVMPPAQISLTLSRHFSLSFIASGRSSGLHLVSTHSCCMYVCSSWLSCFCSAICGGP